MHDGSESELECNIIIAYNATSKVAERDGVGEVGRPEGEAFDGFAATLQPREVGADKGVTENVGHGGEDVGGGGAGENRPQKE